MRGDINLLPKRKASDSTKLASSFIVAIILVVVLSAIFMVYLPNMDKKEIERQVASKELELSTYTVTQEEYTEMADRLSLLRNRIKAFDNINYTNLEKSQVIADVEDAMPANINLSSFSLSGDILSIAGTTTTLNPVLVSQFMVNLRNMEKVSDVMLASVSNSEEGYSFSLTVNYNIEIPEEVSPETPEEEPTGESTDVGMSNKGTQNSQNELDSTNSEEGAV